MLDEKATPYTVAIPDGVADRLRVLNPMYRLTLADPSINPKEPPEIEIGTGYKAVTVQRRFCGDFFAQLDRAGDHSSLAGTGATPLEAVGNALRCLELQKQSARRRGYERRS